MLSGCSTCSQTGKQEERHLEERCLYEHKGLLDLRGKECPSSLRMWSKEPRSVLEKVNMHLLTGGGTSSFLSRSPPDLESTEGNAKRPGPWSVCGKVFSAGMQPHDFSTARIHQAEKRGHPGSHWDSTNIAMALFSLSQSSWCVCRPHHPRPRHASILAWLVCLQISL